MKRLRRKLRSLQPGLSDEQRANIKHGFNKDFELPYPYPRNEHEDGMNWVAVNAVMSGRSGL